MKVEYIPNKLVLTRYEREALNDLVCQKIFGTGRAVEQEGANLHLGDVEWVVNKMIGGLSDLFKEEVEVETDGVQILIGCFLQCRHVVHLCRE